MVKGYMASCSMTAGDKRVGRALSVVSPLYQAQRNSNTARQTSPFPYHADYFGHKLHMDQNEKLVMYGLTEVSACDGYSGKIVAFATMPLKNNVLTYEHIYRYSTINIVYKCILLLAKTTINSQQQKTRQTFHENEGLPSWQTEGR